MSAPRVQINNLSRATLTTELVKVQKELREVEADIIVVTRVLRGLCVVLGKEHLSVELLRLIHPKRRNVRGLSQACKSVLQNAAHACPVREICDHIMESDPRLLDHLRNPKASVMSVLRHLARRGEVIRSEENGRSVWQRAQGWWDTEDKRQQLPRGMNEADFSEKSPSGHVTRGK
jgi:hypothetical protein